MLLTNQRLDKLSASHNDFVKRGMLPPHRATIAAANNTQIHDDDGGPIDDERVTGHVVLSRTPSMYISAHVWKDTALNSRDSQFVHIHLTSKCWLAILASPTSLNSSGGSSLISSNLKKVDHRPMLISGTYPCCLGVSRSSTQLSPPSMPPAMKVEFTVCGGSAFDLLHLGEVGQRDGTALLS